MHEAGFSDYREIGGIEERMRGLDRGNQVRGTDPDEAYKISKEPSMCLYDQPGFVPGLRR